MLVGGLKKINNKIIGFLITILLSSTIIISANENIDKTIFKNEYTLNFIEKINDKILTVDKIIGDIHVKYWEHIINGIKIKNDYILIHIDRKNKEILKYEEKWTDILLKEYPNKIDVNHEKYFWKQVIVFPKKEDLTNFYNFDIEQEFPVICWEIRYIDGRTILYDLNCKIIGRGKPTPLNGFSLSGYNDESWPDPWIEFRENANFWFSKWCNTTNSISLPTPSLISSYVSDPNVIYFYELAHGDEFSFQADSFGSSYTALMVQNDILTRKSMEFAFIGSCHGLTSTGPGTFSYEFRKGQMDNTVTIGYDYMETCPGWEYAIPWQNSMFENMSKGETIKNSFDIATARYPTISDAVVFIGDENLIVQLPPDKPIKPKGEMSGKIGESYTYETITIDINDDLIWFYWDFGDDSYSGWMGPYNTSETCEVEHSWGKEGEYSIRVKAKDQNDAESEWSDSLIVSMPKSKTIDLNCKILLWFLEKFIL